ncbi:MAG: cobaltochelatase subunit CobN [Pseudomonadota bacterium]
MHLLAATPGGNAEEEGIVSLGQTPADVVILSAQDTDLALFATTLDQFDDDYPSVRLANLMHLKQPAAFDLYAHEVLDHARVVIVSLLGGRAYWQYAFEQLVEAAKSGSFALVLMPGDDQEDENLLAAGSESLDVARQIWRYTREGGVRNARNLFEFIRQHFFAGGDAVNVEPPRALPRTQLYHPAAVDPDLERWRSDWVDGAPVAALIFYRAHLQALNTEALNGFIEQLQTAGINPLPIATASLKDASCMQVVNELCQQCTPGVILNTTGFAVASGSGEGFASDVPVLQVMLAGSSMEDWESNVGGLRAADMAMNVALPEMDGRIISRAISFKGFVRRSDKTQSDVVAYVLHTERAAFVAELAARWCRLHQKHNKEKRIALLLANYPSKDGRIGNGVGLDTPASVIEILHSMNRAGYATAQLPDDGTALVQTLLESVTNNLAFIDARPAQQSVSLLDYENYFARLPLENQQAVRERWGEPCDDPRVRGDRIVVAGIRCGNIFIGIQPTRGYDIDVSASYHDPDLVPPHAYLAFYFWLREVWQSDAIVHVGKHGNLEWLPGKGLALSQNCWPEIALGPMPHLYPFIVNDPGEGAQAKRRAQAVILDHLTPAMTRAETYGELQEIEGLLDEYYQALGLDTRRADYLKQEILVRSRSSHLSDEVAVHGDDNATLVKLDAYLCELKESQIRSGLHVFGKSPTDDARTDTLAAMLRLPRGTDNISDSSLLQALAGDFELLDDYDPLEADAAQEWTGARPAQLQQIDSQAWRTFGDTRERLELFARALIADPPLARELPHASAVLASMQTDIAPKLDQSGGNEIAQTLRGLEGRFVAPGPSGAPTRGRVDVLPTGRNFYSVDTRAIPTTAAWHLGRLSADALLMRHLQDHGDYPQTLALSVWGTATMRTGGDDIAQAMALMGVRPVWAVGSGRVTGFEIIPASLLDRPRVDVVLRVSGFFRDAFFNVIDLFDRAVLALAELDEPPDVNPLRARVLSESQDAIDSGMSEKDAKRAASWRVFGSKPGAYGAGLQGLIDERHWETSADLARAYVNWGGYAYGRDSQGVAAHDRFKQRLSSVQVVMQNQDNREHDILDSDDYYQFQGGLHNAVAQLSGDAPVTYLGDHANPAAPRVRTLEEELQRVVRSRVVNPKWLESIRRHGYKGAFEMAATVDYLFAYDATTQLVQDYQYEMVADSYLFDDTSREFLEAYNPDAAREMGERLLEAIQRGLWDDQNGYADRLEDVLLELDASAESGTGA